MLTPLRLAHLDPSLHAEERNLPGDAAQGEAVQQFFDRTRDELTSASTTRQVGPDGGVGVDDKSVKEVKIVILVVIMVLISISHEVATGEDGDDVLQRVFLLIASPGIVIANITTPPKTSL